MTATEATHSLRCVRCNGHNVKPSEHTNLRECPDCRAVFVDTANDATPEIDTTHWNTALFD